MLLMGADHPVGKKGGQGKDDPGSRELRSTGRWTHGSGQWY